MKNLFLRQSILAFLFFFVGGCELPERGPEAGDGEEVVDPSKPTPPNTPPDLPTPPPRNPPDDGEGNISLELSIESEGQSLAQVFDGAVARLPALSEERDLNLKIEVNGDPSDLRFLRAQWGMQEPRQLAQVPYKVFRNSREAHQALSDGYHYLSVEAIGRGNQRLQSFYYSFQIQRESTVPPSPTPPPRPTPEPEPEPEPDPVGPGRWVHRGATLGGEQIDAVRGPGNRIHAISNIYSLLDSEGRVINQQDRPRDGGQNAMNYNPAIDVDSQGGVHILVRDRGGNTPSAKYYYRNPQGQWQHEYIVSGPEDRSYVVGVGADDRGNVHFGQSGGERIKVFRDRGGRAEFQGSLDRIWRADTDMRMRGANGRIFLAVGKNDPNGKTTFTWGDGGGDLFRQMQRNRFEHRGGSGRRGFPDLYVDQWNNVHLLYGAQTGTLQYNKYDRNMNRVFSSDKQIMSGLGNWHLSIGLGTIAVSDSGNIIVVVGLKSDGSKLASNSELYWTYSMDGGRNWSRQQPMGKFTNGGEGRQRPRLVAIGNKFFLFFNDKNVGGISLSTLEFR